MRSVPRTRRCWLQERRPATGSSGWSSRPRSWRRSLAMGKAHELPGWLAQVHDRLGTPVRSVVALGVASAALVLAFDLRPLIEVASAFMLAWYLVTHYAALALPKEKRITSPLFSWYGVVGCVGLLIALPPPALAVAGAAFVTLLGARWVIRRASLPTRR